MAVQTYEIMHMDRVVAVYKTNGEVSIQYRQFLPYDLYLEETGSEKNDYGESDTLDVLDRRINNITNFQHWCASRLLTLDRTYAKEILNSIGMKQAVTDRDRSEIALSYRCVSLTDVYWVRTWGEEASFDRVNLYENHLSNIFMDISLKGRQYTADNQELARDLSTNGMFPKAWKRVEGDFYLYKDGGEQAVDREILASRICRCFDAAQVLYELGEFDGEPVSISRNITSVRKSITAMEAFEIRAQNENKDPLAEILAIDSHGYYMMNILDYLVGNTDRHWGNWGVLVDNETNQPIRLYELMDFNRAFNSYEQMDGANCQTTFGKKMTQREAALYAVSQIGLNQISEVDGAIFDTLPEYREMFEKRLQLLQSAEAGVH